MASSPPSLNVVIPRKRPSINTLAASNPKRRNPSLATPGSTTLARHSSLLRQTSFPPEDGAMSPREREMSADSARTNGFRAPSLKNGRVTTAATRKKGGGVDGGGASGAKRRRITLPPDDAGSENGSVAGSASIKGAGRRRVLRLNSKATIADATSVTGTSGGGNDQSRQQQQQQQQQQDGDEEAEEADDEGNINLSYDGGELTEAEEKRNKSILAARMEFAADGDHAARFSAWYHAAPRKDLVKKLVNHTLSQSVTAQVLTTVQGTIRVFASELIDTACQVRKEWQASTIAQKNVEASAIAQGKDVEASAIPQRIVEVHRGPLTPDHLREALRRSKKGRDGALPGQLGLSLAGLQATIPRTGGRKLFR